MTLINPCKKNKNAAQIRSSHHEQTVMSTESWRGVAIVVCVWGGELFSFKVLFWGCLQCSPTALHKWGLGAPFVAIGLEHRGITPFGPLLHLKRKQVPTEVA